MKRIMGIIGLVIALTVAAPHARGQVTKIQNVDLSISPPSYNPTAVNNNDWIVGNYVTAGSVTQGFLNVPSQATQRLSFPGSVRFTRANGINDSNTVVGDFFGPDGVYHGYIYSGGSYGLPYNLPNFDEHRNKFSTSLFGISAGNNLAGAGNPNSNAQGRYTQGFVVLGGNTYIFGADTDQTYAYAVNDAGVAVGEFLDSGNAPHGFMWTAAGGITEIRYPDPNAAWTICNGINNSGEITGIYLDGFGYVRGFTDVNGTFTTLDLPPNGVSNSGSYVGTYAAPGGAQRGYEASPMSSPVPTAVNVPGAQSTSLYGVSEDGYMVGKYTDAGGVSHGMLLTPDGQPTNIDDRSASGNSTVCQGIAETGRGFGIPPLIVCNYTDSMNNPQAALYDNGSFAQILVSGASSVSANGITDNRVVAGSYTVSNNTVGFSKRGMITRPLPIQGATFTVAYGTNGAQATEYWGDSAGYVESSVCSVSTTTCQTLNLPGATNSFIAGIATGGDVVYTWTDPEGNVHGGYYNRTDQAYYLLDFPGGTGTRVYGIAEQIDNHLHHMIVGRYFPSATSSNFNGCEWIF